MLILPAAERMVVSNFGLGEGDLHFPARKELIVEIGNGLETILHRVELHQCHILLVRVAKDLHRLHLPEFTEDLVQRPLLAYLLLQRTHMQRL